MLRPFLYSWFLISASACMPADEEIVVEVEDPCDTQPAAAARTSASLTLVDPQPIYFYNDVANVLNSTNNRCTVCHTEYVNPQTVKSSFSKILSSLDRPDGDPMKMPANGNRASESDKQILRSWQTQNFLLQAPNGPTPVLPNPQSPSPQPSPSPTPSPNDTNIENQDSQPTCN